MDAAACSASSAMDTATLKNRAFVFVKPHANNRVVQRTVREALLAAKLDIQSEGDLSGTTIDEKKLIDQHYYAIASKATLLEPRDMAVPADDFEAFFGEAWDDVLRSGRAANALQACERLGVDADGLEAAWRACEPENKVVKLGGGFYCGLLEVAGREPLYVFNAFFMTMRRKFTRDGASIHYYVVEWDPAALSWADFRGRVLGPTDPASAPDGSLRKTILDRWRELGLAAAPNKGDNGVHASASPFEGLAERANWLSGETGDADAVSGDPFGAALLAVGVTAETIRRWSVDPRVRLPPAGAEEGSLFDALEDTDATACLEKCIAINNLA